jgi:raffinose/stachyose/melibiose transport system permease protein
MTTRVDGALERVAYGTKRLLLTALPALYALTCLFPIAWLFYTTFKTMPEFATNVLAPPRSFLNVDNYVHVLTKVPILRSMLNTARITGISLVFIVLFAFVNGYFLARVKFVGKSLLSAIYMCSLFIPIHSILVPTYILFSASGIYNKWYSTILPCICMEMATSIFLVASYVKTIPKELEEAAVIDGSSFARTLFRIVLPVSKPVLATCGIISFFHCWNEFPYSLILFNKEAFYTLPLALMRFKGDHVIDYPRMMTSMFVSIVPALVIYVCFSKQIIKGMVAGAIKG